MRCVIFKKICGARSRFLVKLNGIMVSQPKLWDLVFTGLPPLSLPGCLDARFNWGILIQSKNFRFAGE